MARDLAGIDYGVEALSGDDILYRLERKSVELEASWPYRRTDSHEPVSTGHTQSRKQENEFHETRIH